MEKKNSKYTGTAQKFNQHNYTKSSPEHDFIEATHRLERFRVYVYVDIWVRKGAAMRERERDAGEGERDGGRDRGGDGRRERERK